MGESWAKPIDGTELINTLVDLLKEAHDKMDDMNAKRIKAPEWLAMCIWCKETGYDGQGLAHKDDCILVKIRHVIHT